MITRAHCMPYVGQYVMVRTHDGVRYQGVLHNATNEGIYLRTMRGRTGYVNGVQGDDNVITLDALPGKDSDMQQAWFPWLFLPFFALAWLGPWGWAW